MVVQKQNPLVSRSPLNYLELEAWLMLAVSVYLMGLFHCLFQEAQAPFLFNGYREDKRVLPSLTYRQGIIL